MNSNLILLTLFLNCVDSELIDPDQQLCKDLTIDSALRDEEDIDYIIKGDYFWPINSDSGLSDAFAEPISNRWPELPTPVDAAFTYVDPLNKRWSAFIKVFYNYFQVNSKLNICLKLRATNGFNTDLMSRHLVVRQQSGHTFR